MTKRLRYNNQKNYIMQPLSSSGEISPDKNDLFVIRKCATYLHRHLSRHFVLDEESMEFIGWVLGADSVQLSRKIIAFAAERHKQEIQSDFNECDANDFARIAFRAIRNIKFIHRNDLAQVILDLLEKRMKNAVYRGLSDLERNIGKVKKIFTLSENESEAVIFFFIASMYEPPEEFFIRHLDCNRFSGRKHLKNILEMDHYALNEVLGGTLVKTGMLETDRYNMELHQEIVCALQTPPERNLASKFFSPVSKKTLPMDYHLVDAGKIEHALAILTEKTDTPTHLLLYGPPGTGKTTFAHGLAKMLGVPAYEITKGESNQSKDRRTAIAACLNMTNGGSGSLVIVDEADNIVNTDLSWYKRGETQDKGWLNHLLDEPGIRMIWITNDIDGIDSSVLRRFAFSLEFKPFNRQQRIRLWENIVSQNRCKTYFTREDIAVFAANHDASPGVIDLAIKKALQLKPCAKSRIHQAVRLGLEAHQALFHADKKPARKDTIEKAYSLDGLHITGDLTSLFTQVDRFDRYLRNGAGQDVRNLNLLFYGPPGTGKSELARYIAEHLDRGLLCRRPSDLLDPYVGMAEKNIRKAFEQAEQEESVLVIDEVDSMLFPRQSAHRSWEISFTNEFLTQMERFSGILICTTNRLPGMDSAAIRRFNQKIGFDYLLPEGNTVFYKKMLQPLINAPMARAAEKALQKVNNLTPGDFRTVRDRYAFFPSEEISHDLLLCALQEEASIKDVQKGSRRIGF